MVVPAVYCIVDVFVALAAYLLFMVLYLPKKNDKYVQYCTVLFGC